MFLPESRVAVDYLGGGIYRIIGKCYGFSETADIPALLAGIHFRGASRFDPMQTTFFLGREVLVVSDNRTQC
jgi:K+ transporter